MAEHILLDDVKRNPNTVLTVGTFDGVHAGHRAILDTVVRKSILQHPTLHIAVGETLKKDSRFLHVCLSVCRYFSTSSRIHKSS